MTTQFIKGKLVIDASSYAYQILSKNPHVLSQGTRMLDCWAKYTEMTNASKETNRTTDKLDEMLDRMETSLETLSSDVIKEIKRHDAETNSKMLSMISTITSNVNRTCDHLSVDKLSKSIRSNMETWIEAKNKESTTKVTEEIKTLRKMLIDLPGKIETDPKISQDLKELQEVIEKLIEEEMEEVRENHEALLEEISEIPGLVKDDVKKSLVVRDVRDMHTLLKEQITERERTYAELKTELSSMMQSKRTWESQIEKFPEVISKTVKTFSDSNNEIATKMREDTTKMLDKMTQTLQQMEKMTQQRGSNKQKGMEGERVLGDKLIDEMVRRWGIGSDLTDVSGKAHNCDMIATRTGYEPIRLEIKAYENRVGTKEVRKFEDDLHKLKSHGIFVSLHSGIVGKNESMDLEIMANGKVAIYMSKNEYDVNMICDMIDFLQKLHKEEEETSTSTLIKVRPEVMEMARQMMDGMSVTVNHATTQLKDVISRLNTMNVDQLIKLLMNGGKETATEKVPHKCPNCPKTYKTLPGLETHLKTCV